LAVGLAAATLALVLANTISGVVLRTGLVPELGIGAIPLAVAALVVSWNQRSFLVAGLLVASGIIGMIPGLIATGYFAAIVFPGPIYGVIYGLGLFGLGAANGIRTTRNATAANAVIR
jgi:flagellar biosynthesis protein FliR